MFTPQEIQEQTFSKAVFGGYDMQQVDDFLEPLTEDYITLYKENSVLKAKMKILVEKLEEYRKQEASMQNALLAAQKTCDQMVADAEKKCAQMLHEAEDAASAKMAAEETRRENASLKRRIDELERRLRRAQFANLRVEIFKPCVDTRYSDEEVVSHDAHAIRSTPVESAQNILLLTSDVDVVGIDEAQFFDDSIVDVCRQLANNGVRVIVAGLDMDYTGKPFGPMPALMATAEYVTKVHAICVRCGNLAHHSHRLTSDEKQVMLGAQDSYEAICRHCFNKLANNGKA